jgi:hypothetical protein
VTPDGGAAHGMVAFAMGKVVGGKSG